MSTSIEKVESGSATTCAHALSAGRPYLSSPAAQSTQLASKPGAVCASKLRAICGIASRGPFIAYRPDFEREVGLPILPSSPLCRWPPPLASSSVFSWSSGGASSSSIGSGVWIARKNRLSSIACSLSMR